MKKTLIDLSHLRFLEVDHGLSSKVAVAAEFSTQLPIFCLLHPVSTALAFAFNCSFVRFCNKRPSSEAACSVFCSAKSAFYCFAAVVFSAASQPSVFVPLQLLCTCFVSATSFLPLQIAAPSSCFSSLIFAPQELLLFFSFKLQLRFFAQAPPLFSLLPFF
ncbi:hypothetical protein M9H77_18463 [Catharanthus roseus]|uniref:Uncharacterized protein n=1 Tax=Catharanthus roseus TaxID=4058 RepID=A0ACC0B7K6_CATRO|nr:hypothetical protein M9H77_18463 [Catharanthus roseus]